MAKLRRNLSRREVLLQQKAKREAKREDIVARLALEKERRRTIREKIANRKSHVAFDGSKLGSVYQSFSEAITALREQVTPLSLFAVAQTTLENADAARDSVAPYAATVIAACAEKLSVGVLGAKIDSVGRVCDRLIKEADGVNVLLCDKAFKAVSSVAASLIISAARAAEGVVGHDETAMTRFVAQGMDRATAAFRLVEPSRLNAPLCSTYLMTFRTFVFRVWDATVPSADTGAEFDAPLSAEARHVLRLAILQRIGSNILDLLLPFVHEGAAGITGQATTMIGEIFDHVYGTACRDLSSRLTSWYLPSLELATNSLLQLFKTQAPRSCWPSAAALVVKLYENFSFVKRRRSVFFEGRPASELVDPAETPVNIVAHVPSSSLLIRVLDKIRLLEDDTLNRPLEDAVIAVGNTMSVATVLSLLPFNPHRDGLSGRVLPGTTVGADDEEAAAAARQSLGAPKLWARSYLASTVIRRVAHHDSLDYFVKEFLPRIEHCQARITECSAAVEARATELQLFTNLHEQYWRIGAAFCDYPLDISVESFRSLAKVLVGLLPTPLSDLASSAIKALCTGYHQLANSEDAAAAMDDDEDEDDDLISEQEIDLHCDANDADMNPHLFHGISRPRAQHVCTQVIAKFSANIMPKLCNRYEQHESTGTLGAIRAFALVCSPAVMKSILEGILSVAANVGSGRPAAAAGEGASVMTRQRRVVLDIAGEVLPQLPKEHLLALLQRVVLPVVQSHDGIDVGVDDDAEVAAAAALARDRVLQKKAYKLLREMFDHRLSDFVEHLPAIEQALIANAAPTLAGSIKLRLRCLVWLVDAVKMYAPTGLETAITQVLAEVVLATRERSSEAREVAMAALGKFYDFMSQRPGGTDVLLHQVVAGLAAKTPLMLASTIAAMAKLLWCGANRFRPTDIATAVSMVAPLIAHISKEVRGSALVFCRAVLKLSAKSRPVLEAVKGSLSGIVRSLSLVISQPSVASSSRMAMRQLTERLIKTFGEAVIESEFPEGAQRYFHYVAKQLRRTNRLKSHDQQEETDQSLLTARASRLRRVAEVAAAGVDDIESDDEAVERALLGREASGLPDRSAVRPAQAPATRGRRQHGAREDDDGLVVVDEGKVRILTVQQKRSEDEERARKALAAKLFDDARRRGIARPTIATHDINETHRKRERTDDAVDFENEELIRNYGGNSSLATANPAAALEAAKASLLRAAAAAPSRVTQQQREEATANRAARKRRVESDIKTGAEFASKNAVGGDVRKGAAEPFAYVPLNRRFLNKRNRAVAKFRFKAVSSSVKRGEKAKRAVAAAGK